MSPQQEKFVLLLIEGKNQSDAYRGAYSTKNTTDKSIHELSSRLMKNIKIVSRYEKLKQERDEKVVEESTWDKLRLIKEFEKVYDRCMQIEAIIKNGIETGDFKFDSTGAIKCLEDIGKTANIFAEKIDTNVNVTNKLEDLLEDD